MNFRRVLLGLIPHGDLGFYTLSHSVPFALMRNGE